MLALLFTQKQSLNHWSASQCPGRTQNGFLTEVGKWLREWVVTDQGPTFCVWRGPAIILLGVLGALDVLGVLGDLMPWDSRQTYVPRW